MFMMPFLAYPRNASFYRFSGVRARGCGTAGGAKLPPVETQPLALVLPPWLILVAPDDSEPFSRPTRGIGLLALFPFGQGFLGVGCRLLDEPRKVVRIRP